MGQIRLKSLQLSINEFSLWLRGGCISSKHIYSLGHFRDTTVSVSFTIVQFPKQSAYTYQGVSSILILSENT